MPKEPPSQDVPQIHRTPRGIIVPLNSWQLLLRNIARGKHTLITGPTGTGKTTLAVDAAEECRRQYRMFYCGTIFDAEATVIGTPELRGGDTRFRPSRLIEAVQTPGCVLIFDELNRAMAAVHNAALSLLEAAEMVHEGFGVEHAFESVVPVFDEPDLAKLRTIVRAVK